MSDQIIPPPFLKTLDADRTGSVTAFYMYAVSFFELAAPRLMKSLDLSEAEEVQSRIILHCIRDDCRVLREYNSREGSFDGWFAILCLNKTRDYLKQSGRYRQTVVSAGENDTSASGIGKADALTPPDVLADCGEQLRLVSRCLERLDQYCRLLVRMAAEEFKPREMVRVLRWPESKAKKVSDDLRYCREKLKQLLAAKGVE